MAGESSAPRARDGSAAERHATTGGRAQCARLVVSGCSDARLACGPMPGGRSVHGWGPTAAPRRALALVAVVIALVLAACAGNDDADRVGPEPGPAPADGERGLQYVVIPHPDDEYQAWSLVTDRTDAYPVFLLLTQGEAAGACDGRAFQPEHGERAPSPQPFDADDPGRCAEQRVDAWHAFLDGMAELEPALEPDPGSPRSRTGTVEDGEPTPANPRHDAPPLDYDAWVADDHARLVFDLGDGALTRDDVVWAVSEARRSAGELFPVQAERDIVGASFVNDDGHPDCVDYAHDDHVAVDEALWEVDLGVPGAQYNRVCAADPRAQDDGVSERLPQALHEQVWGVEPPPADPVANPDAERVGLAQRVYGWLAFSFQEPGVERYWTKADDEAATPFSREQRFWRAHQ